MPRKTQLSTEAIRHIASGEIGIHAAKSKYGIGENRILRIRQGLETGANPNNGNTQEDHNEIRELLEAVERNEQQQEANANIISELEAKNNELAAEHANLAEQLHTTHGKLLEWKAQAEQARAEAEQARAEAKQALDLVEELDAAKKNLAEAQAARLVLEEEVGKVRRNNNPTSKGPRRRRNSKR